MVEKLKLRPLVPKLLLITLLLALLGACQQVPPSTVEPIGSETGRHPLPLTSTPQPSRSLTPSSTPVIPTWTPDPKLRSSVVAAESDPTVTVEHTALLIEAVSQVQKHRLGLSTHRQPIEAYQIGDGEIRIAFVGGIHGGYEWNTILLAYQAIDFFASHPDEVDESISLFIIPVANPDGQQAVVGHTGRFNPAEVAAESLPGRYNGNGVDLNRNWSCEWVPTAYLGEQEISAGSAPFSEVETRILRFFFTSPRMDAVVIWHSAKPGVFAGECEEPLPEAEVLAIVYAQAAGYPVFENFDDYPVTGDASDWLSGIGIPAVTVELNSHTATDWPQNLAGMRAVLDLFGGS